MRSRCSRSRRSLSATVIAPVIVSPVSCANSRASRCVSWFLMFRLTGISFGVETNAMRLPYNAAGPWDNIALTLHA